MHPLRGYNHRFGTSRYSVRHTESPSVRQLTGITLDCLPRALPTRSTEKVAEIATTVRTVAVVTAAASTPLASPACGASAASSISSFVVPHQPTAVLAADGCSTSTSSSTDRTSQAARLEFAIPVNSGGSERSTSLTSFMNSLAP